MDNCIFCMIAGKDIPASIAYEDDRVVVFHDIQPQAPVHVLMVPKQHIPSTDALSEADKDLAAHMMLKIREVAELLGLENGYRVVMKCGEDGMQTVPHLHMHILGKRKLTWPPG